MQEELGTDPSSVVDEVVNSLGKPKKKSGPKEPPFRVYNINEMKVPVSSSLGKVWDARIKSAIETRKRNGTTEAWEEAFKYYDNDQQSHRRGGIDGERPGNDDIAGHITSRFSETENVVFANANAILPQLYSHYPTVEITPPDIDDEGMVHTAGQLEKVVSKLIQGRRGLAFEIKTPIRKAILVAMLTNCGIVAVDWEKQKQGDTQTLKELARLYDLWANAENPNKAQELEGQIAVLNDQIEGNSKQGLTVRSVSPFDLIVDPSASCTLGTDALWMAEYTFIPTQQLRAKYTTPGDEGDQSIYKPTHILKLGSKEPSSVLDLAYAELTSSKHSDYGFDTPEAFEAAQQTRVCYIWDKTTRRVYLFSANNWKWPIWVWEDPLGLEEFFPFFILSFHESPLRVNPRGEVSFILDQQDAINTINSEVHRMRHWSKMNVMADSRISSQDVEDLLNGTNQVVKSIAVPEGMKITDLVHSFLPPSSQRPELWSKAGLYSAIDRITGVSAVQRGEQLKTNTTNDAVSAYQEAGETRIEEKADLIEDWMARLCWSIATLALLNMSEDEVAMYIGKPQATAWPGPMTSKLDLYRRFCGYDLRASSMQKPTSQTKKKQAMEIARILGQFASASPAVIVVALKALQRAFENEIIISNAEMKFIVQTVTASLNKAGSGPGQPPPPSQNPSPQAGAP